MAGSIPGRVRLSVKEDNLPLKRPFRISGYEFTHTARIVVTLDDGVHQGRGEGNGAYYLGDDVPAMLAAVASVKEAIEAGADRQALQTLLPHCGARNALDAALWDLEAARSGLPAWKAAGLGAPKPLLTTLTLGAGDPAVMAEQASGEYRQARAIKIKLTGELALDLARVDAVRAARPDVWIGVDANQGFGIDELPPLIEGLLAADVQLLEQPLKRGREADLDGFRSPIPLAADESALCLADVAGLVGRFDTVNIKLDKCGGLTEALAIAREAKSRGLGVMVGNMMGSSLATAPAFVVGQLCDIVDLDGPVFLAQDETPSVQYIDGYIHCDTGWGGSNHAG